MHASATNESARLDVPVEIRGKRIRWTWTEGPTKGSTHEHVFNADGTVEWTCIAGTGKGHSAHEKQFGAFHAGHDVILVSYLSSSGYTLTVALHFHDRTMVGFASSAKEWFPCRGTFEVVGG
jgi:hypothetical protein